MQSLLASFGSGSTPSSPARCSRSWTRSSCAYLDDRTPRVDLETFFADHPQVRRHFSATTSLFLRDVALETQRELYTIAGGMERLPRALAAQLRNPPRLGMPARRIDRREHDVEVHFDGPDGQVVQCYDWVVCTVPFSALPQIELHGLTTEKLRIIHQQRYCTAVKALFHCREPFWRADGIEESGGASCLDGPNRQNYYPRLSSPGEGAVLLAAYATGTDAVVLASMQEDARWQLLRRGAAALHPAIEREGMIQGSMFMDWDREPWIRGGCSVPWLDDLDQPNGTQAEARLREQAELAARPEGRLLFAGEHCSRFPAWLEGSARSALDAVAHIAERS